MLVARAAVLVVGVGIVVWTLASSVQTVVLPRSSRSLLTRVHFAVLRRIFDALARPSRSFAVRDRIIAK